MDQPQKESIFKRAAAAARLVLSGVPSNAWMSPLQPIAPFAPLTTGRAWDYNVGWNINYNPRSTERLSFAQLRNMAQNCEVLRFCIETRKDQMSILDWTIAPKGDRAKDPEAKKDPALKEIEDFFASPDKIHDWDDWLRTLLEELFVTDSVTLYRRRTKGGALYSLEPLDGTTIFPLIDETGRAPESPDPAYLQILKGVPKAAYTTEELRYAPRNVRVYTPYGYSITEQLILTIKQAAARGEFQLAFFTEGSTPASYMEAGKDVPAEALQAFEDHLNAMLNGNTSNRFHVPVVPNGFLLHQTKEAILTDKFDEWLARKVCFAFSIAPTPFVAQVNRATAESEKDRGVEEGLAWTKKWVKRQIDRIIREDFGRSDIEFAWREDRQLDALEASQIDERDAKTAIRSLNEIRAERGLPPVEGGEEPRVLTAQGYVPLNSYEIGQENQEKDRQAKANASASMMAGDDEESDPSADDMPLSDEEDAAEKAVKPSAIPFFSKADTPSTPALADAVAKVLRKTGKSVASQIPKVLRDKKAKKLHKADEETPIISEEEAAAEAAKAVEKISLKELFELATIVPSITTAVARLASRKALVQLEIDPDAEKIVDVVDHKAAAYAEQRAAEMVGMRRLSDGTLVPNPNAEWRIDETTRDELRRIIADGLKANIGTKKIAEEIEKSLPFSTKRAGLIALTEVAKANGIGTLNGYFIARSQGGNVLKRWKNGEEACLVCQGNQAVGAIPLEARFPSGDLAPCAHPHCECALMPVVGEG